MMEGVTSRILSGTASHESSRPYTRPRNAAGANSSGAQAGAVSPATGSAAAQPDPQVVQQLAAELSTALERVEGDFSVSVDSDSGFVIVRITDEVTGEIVRQIPPKELVEADRNMERIVGLLVDDQA